MLVEKNDVVVICLESSCEKVPEGSIVTLDGPMLNLAETDVVCMTAIQAIYPYIIGARFGVPPSAYGFKEDKFIVQCPDKESPVIFEILKK